MLLVILYANISNIYLKYFTKYIKQTLITLSLVSFLHILLPVLFRSSDYSEYEISCVPVLSFYLLATLLSYSTPTHKTLSLGWEQKTKMRHTQSFLPGSL